MIAVISEVWPHEHRRADYDRLSAELRPLLETVDGFIAAERFQSCGEPGKFLSLSLWREEDALRRWRNLDTHRRVMAQGRGGFLRDYRIRATEVLRDYGMRDRREAPADSRALFG